VAQAEDERQERDVDGAEDGGHPSRQAVVRIDPGERRQGDQDDPHGPEQQPAPLEDAGRRRIEHDREGERRAQGRQRRIAGDAEQPEDLDRGQGRGERHRRGQHRAPDGQDEQEHRHEHGGADRALTHQTTRPAQRPKRR
jgi:hypothetical protein